MHLLGELIKHWQDYLLQQRRLSKHTGIAYAYDVQHFLTFLFQHSSELVSLQTLENLNLRDCRAWLASRYKDFDARSNARAIASVRNFWRYLLKHHHIESDVFFLLKTPKIKKSLPRPLDHDHTQILVTEIENISTHTWVGLRDKALFMLLYGTGLRISEALSLTQSSIQSDILIVKGKGNKERHVPLLPEVRVCLENYLAICPYRGHTPPLFLGVRGKRLHAPAAALVLRTFRRLYNLPETLTPHALRHTCASHLMNASGDLRGIQTLLGHQSLSSTQIYTDLDTQKLLEVYQKSHPRK